MTTDKEREAFEKWARKCLISILRLDGENAGVDYGKYMHNETGMAYMAWQAALAHEREKSAKLVNSMRDIVIAHDMSHGDTTDVDYWCDEVQREFKEALEQHQEPSHDNRNND